MSDYSKSTNFTAKDTLPTGNAGKIVKGTELDTEFTAIASAIASKANTSSPDLLGTPTAPTATAGSNTSQIANTAFVKNAVDTATGTLGTMSTQNKTAVDITGGTIIGITDLAVADGGTGASTLTGVVIGNGASAMTAVAPSTSGNVLKSNGSAWTSAAPDVSSTSPQLSKAWVSFDGSGNILKAYNVSAVSRTSTGQYTVTFTTAMADTNYAVICSAETTSNSTIRVIGYVQNGGKATGSVGVTCHSLAAYYDPTEFYVCIFG